MANYHLAGVFAVPGTGRRGSYRFHRRPRNAAIKRGLLSTTNTLRGEKVPPSSWNDINRTIERCWKRHRMNRWHEERS